LVFKADLKKKRNEKSQNNNFLFFFKRGEFAKEGENTKWTQVTRYSGMILGRI
jgi:TnpA family transposase